MQTYTSARTQAGASILRILGAVLFIVVLVAWTARHANFVLGRSMMLAFPADDTTYRAAWPSLTGSVSAKDVEFPSLDGSDLTPFHFDQVRVEVPFFQYFRSGFSKKRGAMLNSISQVRIVLSGGRGEYGMPFTSELAALGAASASPFEADGCIQDDLWGSEELKQMGLSPGPTELVVQYKRDKKELGLEQSIDTPGVGKIRYTGTHEMNDAYSLFSLMDGGNNGIAADEWYLEDAGFIAARNRFCAKKDKIKESEFVERHVAAVKRRLAAVGLAVGPELEAAYRDYATRGGSLGVTVKYEPVISGEKLDSEDLGSWVPSIHGQVTINGKSVALALQSTPVRPLPESEDGEAQLTMMQVLQREGTDPLMVVTAPVEALLPADSGVPASAVGATAGPAGLAPAGVASAPAVPARSGANAVTFAADLTLDRLSNSANAVGLPAASATAAPVAPVAPLAKSTTIAKAAPAPAAKTEPMADTQLLYARPARTDDGHLAYTDLAGNVGGRYRVYFKERAPIVVEVTQVEKGVVQVRRRVAGGSVSYPLDKATFDYAELID